jgi:ABC-type amino acid transport substrate-binding protein
MIKKLALSLCFLALLFGAPVFAQDDLLKKEEQLFNQFCSHCHGKHMVNPGTSSFDLRKFPKDDKPRFYESVSKGRGDMPAWGDVLFPEELDLLWHYVKSRAGKEPTAFDSSDASDVTESNEPETVLSSLLITPGTLTACLAKNGGVMSSRRSKGGAGLDYQVALALANGMGLTLAVEWYESEQEEESSPVRESYAMLAYGVCDILPGFALYETSLSAFYKTRAALPRWDNRPDTLTREFQVDLQPLSVSDPYARMEMGVVFRTPEFVRPITRVADLEGLHVGVEQGTLAGVLTLRQGSATLTSEATTLNPGPDFLWKMEQGEFDAALVTVGAYDFHKKQNAISTLVLGDYRHSIGFNLSVAMLKSNRDLLDQIDPLINTMIADGTMAALADKSRLTYSEPRQPWVQTRLTMQDIMMRQ